uniref:Exoribonuclease phosphorolytic domain-containing protein n=2 Tax=Photinus pyralis TaxID=7054 RepID=A0A1Y1LQH4_PHOPY
MEVSDNIHECVKLDIVPAPVMVTISKIGEQCVVDPSAAEEQCATASMVVAISQDRFTTVLQSGSGSLHPSTLRESLKLGLEIGSKLDQALIEVLKQKPAKKQIGFLM